MRTSTLSPIVSRRGVARVSAVWMIVMVILLLVVLGYAYIAQDEAASTERLRESAVAEATQANELVATKTAELAQSSGVLGFSTDPATIPSNVDTANAALAEFKDAFPDMDPVTTFEAAVPSAIQSYRTKVAQIATLQTRIGDLESQLKAERDAKDALQSEKDARIAILEQEARAPRSRASSRASLTCAAR